MANPPRHPRPQRREEDMFTNVVHDSGPTSPAPSTVTTPDPFPTNPIESNDNSQPSTVLPPPNNDQQQPSPIPSTSSSILNDNDDEVLPTTLTTLIPVTTVTQPDTTFTSFSESVYTSIPFPSEFSATPSGFQPRPINTTPASQDDPSVLVQTCAGSGLDAAANGVLAALIVPGLIGLLLWITFAMLRPRFRQVYALREWFVQESVRSKHLGSSFLAWLFPPVPLVPAVPEDVSDAGRSAATDAKLFPSDEQLSQRALFVALLIAFGWSVLALGGALPLYLIGTPCNAEVPSPAKHTGGYSTLLDLSLLRLLRLIDNQEVSILSTSKIVPRALEDDDFKTRTRVIVLTVLAIVLGVLPMLWKILKEFNRVAAYRKRWLQVKCENLDLGWLPVSKAPGFAQWGENQFKDYLVNVGLSTHLNDAAKSRTRRDGRSRRREEEQPLTDEDTEIDIHSLFSITDTERLAVMIEERDEILENLEIAETKYISSFRVTTPDPSILDFVPPPPPDPSRPYISRPLPLAPQRRSRYKRAPNRAYGASSFVAPSSFYKLRGLQGVSGGRFTDSGVHVGLERDGELGPVSETGSWLPPIPDPRYYGPNYAPFEEQLVDEHGMRLIPEEQNGVNGTEEGWVDLIKETPDNDWGSDFNGTPPGTSARRPRPPKESVPSSRRETFPLRSREPTADDPQPVPPPHLRLQPTQPFVRPLDGVNFDDLGEVYAAITSWRSQLKQINNDIAAIQAENYENIANGHTVKGWLMVGKGIRHIPGVELIEGRAKEDIRWDVLQNQRSWMDSAVLWAIIIVVMALLAAGLTAAAGLSLAMAPDFAHYLPFLGSLFSTHPIVAGIATVFAPAVVATIFIIIALLLINWSAKIHGSVSVSGNHLLVFKITFFAMTFVGTVWLVAIGALLYSMESLSTEQDQTKSLANGSIYMSVLALALVINVAIIFPACLLLQPFRLWRVVRSERESITPRQRFRATFPRTYNPSYAMGACILAIVFASTFALIFPLIAPAVVVFLLLTLIAHRYLVGYVYVQTHSQTGGLLQLWLLKRFGTLLSFQPILLGLIFLSREIWIEGGVLVGTGVFVIVFVESYCAWKTRLPGFRSLSPATRNSVELFMGGADTYLIPHPPMEQIRQAASSSNDDSTTIDGTRPDHIRPNINTRRDGMRNRGSFASVLDMMSRTLAVVPSSSGFRAAVPLDTENLNDLTATERAARTHPDAPPRLPPLPFTEHADEVGGILYAPELVAPPPIIWLPNDSAGVARSEAEDLQKYHDLQVTLDVRAHEDVLLRRSTSLRRRPTS
ncbi:hypothetical protein CC2G_000479 [Coprinopsis cinerea AmutBmut pab1-1]|nr:hypothetical protein CC2G_000479 [Coprinopsis cinerea AmutBmut pab1-1]